MNDNKNILPYAPAILQLLRGIVYFEDNRDTWNLLIQYKEKINLYFQSIGIDLFVFESEGFAYLKQQKREEELKLPQLIEKRSLSYPVTLLLILLRERLYEQEASIEGSVKLVLSRIQIKDLILPFLPTNTNEAKVLDKIDPHINKLIEYGFLRKLKDDTNKFEVKRILKAKISMEELTEIKSKLESYARTSELFG
jgi:hypothetical protein